MSIITEQSNEKQHIVEGLQMKNCNGLVGNTLVLAKRPFYFNICDRGVIHAYYIKRSELNVKIVISAQINMLLLYTYQY